MLQLTNTAKGFSEKHMMIICCLLYEVHFCIIYFFISSSGASCHFWIPPHTICLVSISFCSQDFVFYIEGKHCYFKELTTSVFRSSSYSVHFPPPHSQILLFWLLSPVALSIMYLIEPKSTAILKSNCAGTAIPECERTIESGFVCYWLALQGKLVPLKRLASACQALLLMTPMALGQTALELQWLSVGSVWEMSLFCHCSPQSLVPALSLDLLSSLCPCTVSLLMSHVWDGVTRLKEIPGALSCWTAGRESHRDWHIRAELTINMQKNSLYPGTKSSHLEWH